MINSSTLTEQPAMTVYPAIGHPVEGNAWRVSITGFAWHPPGKFNRRQRMMIGMLRNVMGVSPEELESPIFERRINQFMAAACQKLPLAVEIGGQKFPIRKRTRRNGKFTGSIVVPDSAIESSDQHGVTGVAAFKLVSNEFDAPLADGKIFLYPAQGVSIVSDIDDTIKDSQVGDRKELLANTFLRDFRSIDGMASLYQEWSEKGAAFHYVSSSPWQLFDALQGFSDQSGFPSGTMHLRNFRLRDHLLRKLVMRRNGKVIAIRKLLQALPERKFVLIGDSGEKDPKIYRKICQQFPGRVKAVFIRDVDYRPLTEERAAKLARANPMGLCRSFTTADELRKVAADVL